MIQYRRRYTPSMGTASSSYGFWKYSIVLILIILLLSAGCRKAPTGNSEAVQNLYGQRVGVVIRSTRYLFGEHGGDPVNYKAHVASDSPGWVYALSRESLNEIEDALGQLFQPVMLDGYTIIAEEIADLKFDGDLLLVTPNNPDRIMPPDATLTQIISEEKLAGLIVIDQDWYLDTKNYDTLGCGVEINLMDEAGTILFNSKPGLATDGEAKLTNLMQDFLQNLSFSIAGTPSTDDIQDAIDEVSVETADSIVQRLQEFAPRQ